MQWYKKALDGWAIFKQTISSGFRLVESDTELIYWWLSARLQYHQCISNGDTAVFHWAIDIKNLGLSAILTMSLVAPTPYLLIFQ